MRFVRDHAQFALGQLLLSGFGIARENATCRADLDHFGAIFALAANFVAQAVIAIGNAFLRFFKAGWQEGRIAMAAGGTNSIAGGNDPWPYGIATVDCLFQADVVAIVGTDVAHSREACVEHCAGIANCRHAPEAVRKFEPAITANIGRAVEMNMHIDQAGQQGFVA